MAGGASPPAQGVLVVVLLMRYNGRMTEICVDCKSLQERSEKHGSRRVPGHSRLKAVGEFRNIVSPYGWRADEQDYECGTCGQKWMHETGSYGHGWVMQ